MAATEVIAVYHCSVPLRCTIAVCQRGVPLRCTNAVDRGVPLRCTIAVYQCGVPLQCASAVAATIGHARRCTQTMTSDPMN